MSSSQKTSLLERFATVIRWGGFIFSLAMVVAVFSGIVLYGVYRTDIPNVLAAKDYRPSLKSKVYAANGELIAEFGTQKRVLVAIDKMPPLVAKAFVASEDKKFYRHNGIDFVGILSAVFQSLSGQRSSLRGASTITQQLAKSLLVKKEGYESATARTLSRKIKEAILARKLEMHLEKDEILWMYLNEVYLGHGSYGVGAAADNYFRSELSKLSIGQIALIAGLPQAPSRYSPQSNMQAALNRQAYVLGRMLEEEFISQQEHDQAISENRNLVVYERDNTFRTTAPYFSEHVRRILLERYGEKTLYEDGLKIFTTLDIERERAMQKSLRDGVITTDKRQGFFGPVFKPSSPSERALAEKLVAQTNQQDLLELSGTYQLAQVIKTDQRLEAVFIDLGGQRGVIPLTGMLWARRPDPRSNYVWWQLQSVKGVLAPGDVVLVSESSVDELKENTTKERRHAELERLITRHKKDLGSGQLKLYSLEQEPKIEGAMLALEPQSGYVVAMNGGYSYDKSEFNRVYQACRQPGSLFKPLVYSAAVALKKYTPATLVLDTPLTFRDSENELSWKPKNFGQKYRGEVTVREAIMRSMNVPTLNIMSDVGARNVITWAKKMGIDSNLKLELGTGIGSSCVTPWELSRVFSTIANLGKYVEPVLIKEIRDRENNRLEFRGSGVDPWIKRGDRVSESIAEFFKSDNIIMNQEDAYTMHYLMTQVAKSGTARRTKVLNRVLGAKTGTTNDSYDTWFSGYTKNLMSIIWLGYDTMETPLGVYEQGARTALPLFNNFMLAALGDLPSEEWEMPKTMCEAFIDTKTGLRVEEESLESFIAPFKCGEEPGFLKDAAGPESLEQLELMGGMDLVP